MSNVSEKKEGQAIAFTWKDINFIGNMVGEWDKSWNENVRKKSSIQLVSVSFTFNAVNHENARQLTVQYYVKCFGLIQCSLCTHCLHANVIFDSCTTALFPLHSPIIFSHVNAAFDYAKLNIKYVNYSWIILYKSNRWTFVRSIACSGYGSISKLNHHFECYWMCVGLGAFFSFLRFVDRLFCRKISDLNARLMYVCAINLRELDLMWYF